MFHSQEVIACKLTLLACLYEVGHAKTGIKMFAIVIPKEGLDGISPAKPSLSMTPTIELHSVVVADYILQLCHTKKKVWLG